MREELDALHILFVEAIATGRKVAPKKINDQFGQGSVLLADEALKRGMIDAVAGPALKVVESAKTSASLTEYENMDIKTLKEQHAGVYAEVLKEGAEQERDRVSAHITMGEASGDMKTALEAITSGSAMTATLQAKYMAAGLARRDISAREADEAKVAEAANAPAQASAEDSASNKVLALVEKSLGLSKE